MATNGGYIFEQEILAGDGEQRDRFGFGVTGAQDNIVVGAFGDDAERGAIYVYAESEAGWAQVDKIVPSDGDPGDQFGVRVDFEDNWLVTGSVGYDNPAGDRTGAIYVYDLSPSGFGNEAILTAPSSQANGGFGEEVAVSNDTIAVGARLENDRAGAVYVFEHENDDWGTPIRLAASDATSDRIFGGGLAIDGDTIAVGANFDDPNGNFRAGSVYIFNRQADGTWLQDQDKVLAPDGEPSDEFGSSVAIDGDTLVVGSLYDDADVGLRTGSVHVYERSESGWDHVQQLLASDPTPGAVFGGRVNIEDGMILVGAQSLNDTRGATYVFKETNNGWVEVAKLVAPDAQSQDAFGIADFVGTDIVVGAFGVDGGGANGRGAAYVFGSENTAPEAVDDSVTTAYATPVLIDLLENDSDPDGDALNLSSIALSNIPPGTIVLGNDGVVEFTPEAGFVGETSFNYTVDDIPGATSNIATVEIVVEAPDGATSGDDGDNTIDGGNKLDILVGLDGEDDLSGGNGNDIVLGNDGEDTLNGGNGSDQLFGGADNNSLFGGNGNDFLDGGRGDDLLNGGRGNDTLIGREGDDTLEGDKGDDLFIIAAGDGTDTLLDFDSGNDLLGLLEADPNDLEFSPVGADTHVALAGETLAIVLGDPGINLDDVVIVDPSNLTT